MTHRHAVQCAALLFALAVLLPCLGCRDRGTNLSGNTPRTYTNPQTQPLTGEARLTARRGPQVSQISREPALRIRIARSLTAATLSSNSPITVGPGSTDTGRARSYSFAAPLRIGHDGQGFVLTDADGNRVRWGLMSIAVSSPAGGLSVDGDPYPGRLELVVVIDRQGQRTASFDIVNHVGMESYLPGVLSKELYAGWDIDTYRAQAVAARSYAIWEMGLPIRQRSHFDLEASQASQAYIGGRATDKARQAVADTAGQVLVYDGRVLPAFYSSCSGGTGQDAYAVWPEKVDDLAPLRGRDHGGWGQISNRYRWGPVTRDRSTLSRRIAAWGQANEHRVARIGPITRVQVTATNSVGRPTRVGVTDMHGVTFAMSAEELRMASNFNTTGLPTIDASTLVFSSHANWHVSATAVTITGQGFGHGVGMCQFGAQHMASQGQGYQAILGFYYPGASLRRAY